VSRSRAALGWIWPSVVASCGATVLDCLLLQRRRSYFTGGFLSVDSISTLGQAVAFVAGSLLADIAVLGPIVLVALWLGERSGFSRGARLTAALVLALAPVAAADFVSYQLQSFLGDGFDFALMWDLVGRRPSEILAVSSSHFASIVWVAAVGLAITVAGAILIRRAAGRHARNRSIGLRRAIVALAVVSIGGTAVVTAQRITSDVLDNGLKRKPTARALGILVDVVSDVDRDGFGILGRFRDPDPFDSRVYPFAADIPGDGIDQDGVGGDLPVGDRPYREPPDDAPVWRSRQSVVLIALESFRADVRGALVDGEPVTPVLDQLAREGLAVPYAYSHNGYTVQSRYHIFSGSVAGLRRSTLIDDFKANGYETAYFSGQDDSFGGPEEDVGMARADVSFDARMDVEHRYTRFATPGSLAVPFNVLNERIASFLASRHKNRPLFLYANFHDTHFPYHHASVRPLLRSSPVLQQFDIVASRRDELLAMYRNTAANVDRAIGDLLARVRRSVGEDVGVIVLSDHGESLFDQGFLGHGYALNDAQTRIPLVVAHLPIAIVQPFGQSDLRDDIRAAMAAAPGAPSLRADPAREVFQYLGTVDQPAQIGLAGLDRQLVYDFRTNLVSAGTSPWKHAEALAPADHEVFLRLIRMWERMILAKRGGGDH